MTAATLATRPPWRERHPRLHSLFGVWMAAGCAGLVAFAAALGGMKGSLAIVAGSLFVAALVLFKPREEIILATATLSVGAMMHKSFGALAEVSSGPPSIYVSSLDVMIGLLWFSWFVMDPYGMAADLRLALRRKVLYLPLVAMALMMPGVLAAENSTLAIAELVRMTSMYFLFVYFALRIRTKVHVWVVLGSLAAVGVIEAVVALGQKFTSSALGLSVFGTPEILHNRYDGIAVARPFGTMAHPVFMAAFVGGVAMVAYSIAVNQRSWKTRLLWLALSGIAVSPIIVANARAASLGIVVAFVVMSIVFMVTGRLSARVVATALVLAGLALIPAWGYVSQMWTQSVGNDHFSLEWESRWQLNEIAVAMIEDTPFVGHGLNNFEEAMPRYDKYGLIFADNPVHNVYLLQVAETGIIGLAGMAILVIGILRRAIRLARSRDRLYSAVGFGVVGAFVFWSVEELLVFSLRQDHPRALFFMLCGLVVACGRMAGFERPPRPDVVYLRPSTPAGGGSRHGTSGPNGHRNGNGSGNGSDRIGRTRPMPVGVPAGPRSSRAERLARARARRRQRTRRFGIASLALAIAAGAAMSGTTFVAGSAEVGDANVDTSQLKVVFQAIPRGGDGKRAIFTANGDGTDIQRITPADGRDYSWVTWAQNGNKILYTARPAQAVGQAEQVYLANADGSGARMITTNPWRNAQPKMTPDGRTVIFTSRWSEFRDVALYSLDLETLMVTNLSAVTQEGGAVDADPKISKDGREIVFAASKLNADGSLRPTEVALMNLDGSNRRILTSDTYYDTDPALSADGTHVAIASYRGEGTPATDANSDDPFQVKLRDFLLVNRNIASGTEQILTAGLSCAERPDSNACTPSEAPAYVPVWTPDGTGIGYVGVLSNNRTCVCVADPLTGGARTVIESTALSISWFDWVVPGPPPATAVTEPGSKAPASRMLFTGLSPDNVPMLAATTPDRWGQLGLQPNTFPGLARWTADRSKIVASVRVDASTLLGGPPDPPPGDYRHRHYTLDFMRTLFAPPVQREGAENEQVVIMNGDGSGAQFVTDPWTEDHLDAIPDGELRGNTTPDISADGRYIVFTNVSTVSLESFILRKDLVTGEVLNLTNATAGAMPVADFQPRFSPDANQVAFATVVGEAAQIAVVDRDGYGYRELTNDDYFNVAPAWSPDGRFIVYASYRGNEIFGFTIDTPQAKQGDIPINGWVLVRLDVATGEQKLLTAPEDSPVFQPTYSPDGSQIAFISLSEPGQPDIYVVGAEGGRPRPVQVTHETDELFVDWK